MATVDDAVQLAIRSNPGKKREYVRRNGPYTLTMPRGRIWA